MTKRWTKRPESSTWGDWGENDQLGRLNLIDANKVKQGLAEVIDGRSFSLSLPLNYPGGTVLNPNRLPPKLGPAHRHGKPYYNFNLSEVDARLKDVGSDDWVTLYNQYSTHWDSLAHRGAWFDVNDDGNPIPVYYNGFRANEHITLEDDQPAAKALGIQNPATHGIQGRAVMVDLFSEYGEFPRKEVNYNELMRIMEKDQVIVEPGDILCLWTGLDQMILRMQGNPDESIRNSCAVLDGHDQRLLDWIRDSQIAAICSDNLAIEAIGKDLTVDCCHSNLPLHEWCLFRLGVHLAELWHLADLATYLKQNNRSRFLLTAPPIKLTNAVGAPTNPIGTV